MPTRALRPNRQGAAQLSVAGPNPGADGGFCGLARRRTRHPRNRNYGASASGRNRSVQRRQRPHGTAPDEPRADPRELPPPVAERPADRPAYTSALQDAQAGRGAAAFERLLLSAWKRPEGVPCCRARGADHLRSAESGWSLGSALSKLGQAASNAQNATNRLGSLSPKLS
jgi:hypothetical protein